MYLCVAIQKSLHVIIDLPCNSVCAAKRLNKRSSLLLLLICLVLQGCRFKNEIVDGYSVIAQENLKRLLTFMAMRHKAIVEMAWISSGKLFVDVRERRFYSLEFQNDSFILV